MSCFMGSVSKVLFKDKSGKAGRWEEHLGCPEQAVKGPSLLWVGHILMLFIFFLFFEGFFFFFFLTWTIFKVFYRIYYNIASVLLFCGFCLSSVHQA